VQIQVNEKNTVLTNDILADLKILIVDDETAIRETLELYLKHIGIGTIQTSQDGSSALKEVEKNEYDYLFLDLFMPDMHGMEVLKQVRQNRELTNVIIMTGHPSMEVAIEAMHNGAADFLIKPFLFQNVELIIDRIQRIHHLMQRNWLLNQELEKKKEVENLNHQLEKQIRLQTILYNIVDTLSKINTSEELYKFIVQKAVESSNAERACFFLYDRADSALVPLARKGLDSLDIGGKVKLKRDAQGREIFESDFIKRFWGKDEQPTIPIHDFKRANGLMSIPFNIRNEPFGILLLKNGKRNSGFQSDDEFICKFLAEKTALNIENIALYDNLKENLFASLMSLVSAIEAKDPYTQQHSSRVTEYSIKIAKKMNCGQDDLRRLESVGPLHDIGKIGIRDNILNKPDRLTDEEFEHIKTHPLIGENIVSPLGLDDVELSLIRNHHERWDGKGYPDAIKGEKIPFLSRILAVADAFDAMSSNRAYRKALPPSICIKELRRNSGTQFDPDVVKAALTIFTK